MYLFKIISVHNGMYCKYIFIKYSTIPMAYSLLNLQSELRVSIMILYFDLQYQLLARHEWCIAR